ncbi:MAG: hypothetical protein Ta2B_14800 [Termitinemataceae bacterium]|nr:MAG: hypothetical protein Ta2B_14800 [Termitinemataceae bacterium]
MPDMKYFWGRSVTGFNSKKHCLKCLKTRTRNGKKGHYAALHKKQLATVNTIFEPEPTPEGFFYLCACKDQKETEYIHFVLKQKPDAKTVIKSKTTNKSIKGMTICATGAEEITIDHDEYRNIAEKLYPQYKDCKKQGEENEYWDCWNFQFGMKMFPEENA